MSVSLFLGGSEKRERERERGKKVLRYEKIDKGKASIPMNEYKGIQN